ncbi:hypothetical protein [Bacteroides acidifaciens]|jgi:hypothetical protein|uniref:hypothetical protein n=1 Tax=Bacteroides acidifaciens TaxID=85831 RepID=UPI002596834B|nr:hypothetical protein [Bacteroides acidifaciens]
MELSRKSNNASNKIQNEKTASQNSFAQPRKGESMRVTVRHEPWSVLSRPVGC